ncbi:phenolic acid decarboxylase [Nocardia altamirensis]|uniref:phenolic acid decarboxylase n=1 Tax=Nocardia altamirensis TaxID=472158 RepID=UPI00084077EE|nr:phenolic acid decarboxylase [Nocardia altamirensis]
MTTSQVSTPLPQDNQDLCGLLGKHLIYTYSNGWKYELYIKNASTVEYRVHPSKGEPNPLTGRWVKDLKAVTARLGDGLYSVAWVQVAGTCASLVINTQQRWLHFAGFLAKWANDNPAPLAGFQNDHLDEILRYRDIGPIAPQMQEDLFATITFLEDRGVDNEDVIAYPPEQVPDGFLDRTN